jgi:hypothetical protein
MLYICTKQHKSSTDCRACPMAYGIDHKCHKTLSRYHNHGSSTWIYYDSSNENDPCGDDGELCPITMRPSILMRRVLKEERGVGW